jgi:hypothetical protein
MVKLAVFVASLCYCDLHCLSFGLGGLGRNQTVLYLVAGKGLFNYVSCDQGHLLGFFVVS